MKKSEKFNAKRRAALKKSMQGAVATGAVATSYGWSKPVVESIVLPTHATATGKSIAITNVTVNESDCPDCGQLFSSDDPVSGSNIGTFPADGSADSGEMSANGVITPPPPPGTMVEIFATAQLPVDSANANCFFSNENPCVVQVPVNSTNGDFSLAGTSVNGLDDNNGVNEYTITFVCMDAPPFVLAFNTIDDVEP